MYGLTRGGLEVVAWGSGFRQAGERRSVIGKRHGGLRESAGIPALQQLRSVVNPTGRNPTSPLWFVLSLLCKVVL